MERNFGIQYMRGSKYVYLYVRIGPKGFTHGEIYIKIPRVVEGEVKGTLFLINRNTFCFAS
jgi:hypothetical protein